MNPPMKDHCSISSLYSCIEGMSRYSYCAPETAGHFKVAIESAVRSRHINLSRGVKGNGKHLTSRPPGCHARAPRREMLVKGPEKTHPLGELGFEHGVTNVKIRHRAYPLLTTVAQQQKSFLTLSSIYAIKILSQTKEECNEKVFY